MKIEKLGSFFQSETDIDVKNLVLLKAEDVFAKHSAAGTRNSQPGKTGKRSPITPIIKKINPKNK